MNNYLELVEIIESGGAIPDRHKNYVIDLIVSKINPQRRRDDLIRQWSELEAGSDWQKATRLCGFVRLIEQNYKVHTVPIIIRRAYEIRRIPATVQYICDHIL
jgi:hypothetical protein